MVLSTHPGQARNTPFIAFPHPPRCLVVRKACIRASLSLPLGYHRLNWYWWRDCGWKGVCAYRFKFDLHIFPPPHLGNLPPPPTPQKIKYVPTQNSSSTDQRKFFFDKRGNEWSKVYGSKKIFFEGGGCVKIFFKWFFFWGEGGGGGGVFNKLGQSFQFSWKQKKNSLVFPSKKAVFLWSKELQLRYWVRGILPPFFQSPPLVPLFLWPEEN